MYKLIIVGVGLVAIVIAAGVIMSRKKAKGFSGTREKDDSNTFVSDTEIVNALPPDMKQVLKISEVPSTFRINEKWLHNDVFYLVLSGDAVIMNRLCRHIVEASCGRYRVAARVGDLVDANFMVEKEIVSGNHYVKEIEVCGVVDTCTGKALFKAIVK